MRWQNAAHSARGCSGSYYRRREALMPQAARAAPQPAFIRLDTLPARFSFCRNVSNWKQGAKTRSALAKDACQCPPCPTRRKWSPKASFYFNVQLSSVTGFEAVMCFVGHFAAQIWYQGASRGEFALNGAATRTVITWLHKARDVFCPMVCCGLIGVKGQSYY